MESKPTGLTYNLILMFCFRFVGRCTGHYISDSFQKGGI